MGRKEIYDAKEMLRHATLIDSLPYRYEVFLKLTNQTDTDDQLKAWVHHLSFFATVEPFKRWCKRTKSRNNNHEMRLYKDEINLAIKNMEEQSKLLSTL
jgi:hypothetical protein